MAGKATKSTLLLLDNDEGQLKTWTEVLRKGGYKVIAITSERAARQKLEAYPIDLAVIDLHLLNDNSPNDFSGLEFAKSIDQSIPKIILTAVASTESVREALRGRDRIAVDYVEKGDRAELLEAVRRGLRPRVFLVHGRDTEALLSVKEFIKDIGLWPVILKDEAGGLAILLTHFSRHANVDFALVIATPDDVGSLAKPRRLQPRPRQNVIFELGFFCAKLPTDRIVLLKKKPEVLEMPSDVNGVRHIELDAHGGWKEMLQKELRRAGFEISEKI